MVGVKMGSASSERMTAFRSAIGRSLSAFSFTQ